jgi:hypothetical protein
MAEATLDQVQRMVDALSPIEQVRLLEYLTPRIARAVEASQTTATVAPPSSTDAWTEFFRIGDTIGAADTGTMDSLTVAVLSMRR